jgi:hypothetical protein
MGTFIKSLFGIGIWGLFFFLVGKINIFLFYQMYSKIEDKAQFKIILENLEESIIIASGKEINYMNNKCIHDFQKTIKELSSQLRADR